MVDADFISSLQNPRVKQVVKLRERRGRDQQQRILIDGLREIRQALDGGVVVDEVFWCEQLATTPPARELLRVFQRHGVLLREVSETVWDKMSFGHRRDGILVVAVPPQRELHQLTLTAQPLVVILDGVEKPGNVGAVCRSADAVAASALILSDGGTDIYNPNAIRASVGTLFRMPVVSAGGAAVRAWLRQHDLTVYVAHVEADRTYDSVDWQGPTAVVLGSEATGVSQAWLEDQDRTRGLCQPDEFVPGAPVAGIGAERSVGDAKRWIPVRLPMLGAADSLNVSNTAAVLLYEALRQRQPRNQA